MAISNTPRSFGAGASQGNGLVSATLDVEVNAGAVALVWSVSPNPGGRKSAGSGRFASRMSGGGLASTWRTA